VARWISADVGNLAGRRAIVTGANTGLGFRTALALAGAGAEVVLAVRSPERGGAAAERIRAEVPGAEPRVSLVDLADLRSVRAFAEREAAGGPLDILVNNAGVMLVPQREFTADGFEKHMGVNHLGHVLLTAGLLPALSAAPAGRVVSVTSLAYLFAGRLDRSLGLQGRYRPMAAYGQSKLAALLFAGELDRRLGASGSSVVSLAAHPGWSATELFDRDDRPGPFVRLSRWATQLLGSSPEAGARPQVRAAAAVDVPRGGLVGPSLLVYGRPRRTRIGRAARDSTDAAWLWDRSVELTGARFDLPAGQR
jgi:NAD(P)-dependent dehydrogenase (short-subunit alcohol dehydrogenase family)